CGHCKKTIPHMLKLHKEMKRDSLQMACIATARNTEKNIGEFIKTYKVNVPVFQDTAKAFSSNYGTGFVPVILLVNKKGNYIHEKLQK
ncbi:TlpA disulfide reductase family protein, partial [Fibrobacterota bacterium]